MSIPLDLLVISSYYQRGVRRIGAATVLVFLLLLAEGTIWEGNRLVALITGLLLGYIFLTVRRLDRALSQMSSAAATAVAKNFLREMPPHFS